MKRFNSVTIIKPQSFVLPREFGVRRATMIPSPWQVLREQFHCNVPRLLRRDIRHALARQSRNGAIKPTFSWLAHKPDDSTIIYDVFRSYDDQKIIAICAPLRNLEQHLLPLTVCLEGQPVAFEFKPLCPQNPIFSTYIIEIKTPPAFVKTRENLNLEFRFQSLRWRATVAQNIFCADTDTPTTLITKQKNNPVPWIQDWCIYHHRVHNIKHILIYNYGSDTDTLSHALASLAPDLKITLVVWNFPFGDKGAISEFAYLNHAHYLLGDATKFRVVLDVDEYLINPTSMRLDQYLDTLSIDNKLNLRIPGVSIPAIYASAKDMHAEYLPRVFNFPYQRIMHNATDQQGTFPKTIFSNAGNTYVSTHFVTADDSVPLGACEDFIWRHKPKQSAIGFVDSCLGKLYPPYRQLPPIDLYSETKNQEMVVLDKNKLYYNHYLGLNVGWKNPNRLRASVYNPKQHVEDLAMKRMLALANLRDLDTE